MAQGKTKAKQRVKRTLAAKAPTSVATRIRRRGVKHPPASAACVAAIGASAGGLNAIREFLRAMPARSGIAFIVIQHLDPQHKSLVPELLARCTSMPVMQAENGVLMAPDHVYTNPPGTVLSIKHGVLRVAKASQGAERHSPIDHFFASLGEDQKERAIGIILSGSGADGAFGMRKIVENGGLVIAQQPESAQFDGMPRSAIQTGLVSAVLPLANMPQALIEYARHPYIAGVAQLVESAGATALGHIMERVRSRCGFDFSGYKQAMLQRRIHRRMGLRGVKQAADYVRVLASEPQEVDALYKDLLIGVTEFFRDPAAWDALDAEVIRPLVESRGPDDGIRVWVAGVASGEEAYSIAMLLIERVEAAGKHCAIQIFASDTNEATLAIARAGIYPAGVAARMPAQRLRRFFTETPDGHHHQVCEQLRAAVVFCAHNLLRDPPYSKMDLVSCRNLLIYLEPDAQNRAIQLIHFALRPGGYLFLGTAETPGADEALFQPVSKKWRLFRRAGKASREPLGITLPRSGQRAVVPLSQGHVPQPVDVATLVQRLIVERFAPAAVLTDSRFNAIYFCGPTDRFLAQPKGGPTQDLLALAREGLRSRLRSAIRDAEAAASPVVISDARVRRGNAFEPVKVTVLPAGQTRDRGGLLLVVFEEVASVAPVPLDLAASAARLVKQLEEELRTTREDLTSTIERQELSVEALRTSNEEVVSANEELQSMNEELESSKEELQSLNEELNSVNQQLEGKIVDLEAADSDLQNALASSEIATLCLDSDFRVRWFSPAAGTMFSLVRSDIGRPVNVFAPLLSDASVIAAVKKVISERRRTEAEVCSNDQQRPQWYLRRILPYQTHEGGLSGVVLTFTDITEIRRKTDEQLASSTARSQDIEALIEERIRLLRAELFKLATGEERDRHEIATELHDALCQPLAAASMHLAARQPRGAAPSVPPEALELIASAERAARSLMFRISPPVLFDLGLGPALAWLAEEMERSHRLVVKMDSTTLREPLALDETVRAVLFRCVRELLTNVAKHAKVHVAEVSAGVEGRKVIVRVSDAGVGFDATVAAPRQRGGRFGLVSVRERLAFVDGTFVIESIPGDGTVATITVPLTTRGRHRGSK